MAISTSPRALISSGALVATTLLVLAGCAQPAPQSMTASNSDASPQSSASGTSSTTAPMTSSTSSAPDSSSASESAGQALCSAAMLSGTVQDAGAGAGHVFLKIVVKNSSDTSCTLDGYPGVSLVGNGNGTQLGAAADRDPAKPSQGPINLAPGQSAAADLQVAQASNYQSGCTPSPADGIRIYPPSATDALYIPKPLTACADNSVVLLQIGAFAAL